MKKNKEHKKGESTIGKIIYGFLLFMPLFAIGVTCGYAMFNKNAYKSYSNFNENEDQYVNVTSYDELVVGRTYRFISSNIQNPNLKTTATGEMVISNVVIEQSNVNTSNWDLSKINNFYVWNYSTLTYFRFGSADNSFTNYSLMGNNFTFTFTYVGLTNINNSQTYEYSFDNYVYKNDIQYQNNTIDNVFYYSVDKVTESPLFNWAENSIIYTTMNATCTQLSITTPFIPLLLSYWLIISVIYFLYDIALMLIWLLHDKIHELRDSLA